MAPKDKEKPLRYSNPHEILDGFDSLRRHHAAKAAFRHKQLAQIPVSKDTKILDVGAGPGLYMEFWLRQTHAQNAQFFLLDHSQPALTEAFEVCKRLGEDHRVSTIQGDLFELKSQVNEKFGVVFIGNTIEYIQAPVTYLEEQVMPILIPGGLIAVRDLDCSFARLHNDPTGLNQKIVDSRDKNCQRLATFHDPFMGRKLKAIFESAGCKSVEEHRYTITFEGPLSDDQKAYLAALHQNWYVEDSLSLLTPEEIQRWRALFDLNDPSSFLHREEFSYEEVEYLVIGKVPKR